MKNLSEQAKKHLKGQWGTAIIAILVVNFITSGPNLIIQLVPSTSYEILLLANLFSIVGIFLVPAQVGLSRFFLDLQEDLQPSVDQVFYGFKNGRYGRSLGALLLMSIFIFLWTLLLIIPGIIKIYAYAMTPYILADPKYDHIPAAETITISKRLMEGHKGELFGIQLFYTWWIIITIPIGYTLVAFGSMTELGYSILAITAIVMTFYIGPLLQQITAEFYRSLSKKRVPQVEQPYDPFASSQERPEASQLNDPLAWDSEEPSVDNDESSIRNEDDDDDNPFYQ